MVCLHELFSLVVKPSALLPVQVVYQCVEVESGDVWCGMSCCVVVAEGGMGGMSGLSSLMSARSSSSMSDSSPYVCRDLHSHNFKYVIYEVGSHWENPIWGALQLWWCFVVEWERLDQWMIDNLVRLFAAEMTCILSGWALNSVYSLTQAVSLTCPLLCSWEKWSFWAVNMEDRRTSDVKEKML